MFNYVKDCFNDSDNEKGILDTINDVASDKVIELLGEVSLEQVKLFDKYIISKIGGLFISPVILKIFSTTDTLLQKQQDAVNLFLMTYYDNLIKIKNSLNTTIDVGNTQVKTEVKHAETDNLNKISSFNSEDLSNDTNNINELNQTKTLTTTDNNTSRTITNIDKLKKFYKKPFIDIITEYLKEFFSLQII